MPAPLANSRCPARLPCAWSRSSTHCSSMGNAPSSCNGCWRQRTTPRCPSRCAPAPASRCTRLWLQGLRAAVETCPAGSRPEKRPRGPCPAALCRAAGALPGATAAAACGAPGWRPCRASMLRAASRDHRAGGSREEGAAAAAGRQRRGGQLGAGRWEACTSGTCLSARGRGNQDQRRRRPRSRNGRQRHVWHAGARAGRKGSERVLLTRAVRGADGRCARRGARHSGLGRVAPAGAPPPRGGCPPHEHQLRLGAGHARPSAAAAEVVQGFSATAWVGMAARELEAARGRWAMDPLSDSLAVSAAPSTCLGAHPGPQARARGWGAQGGLAWRGMVHPRASAAPPTAPLPRLDPAAAVWPPPSHGAARAPAPEAATSAAHRRPCAGCPVAPGGRSAG